MFNLIARKSLNLIMAVSMLTGVAGSHPKPSALVAPSFGLISESNSRTIRMATLPPVPMPMEQPPGTNTTPTTA
jgi:hypothetical protein